MRVRGLKLERLSMIEDEIESHPMRVRGLKHDVLPVLHIPDTVAPHAGAWIETILGSEI